MSVNQNKPDRVNAFEVVDGKEFLFSFGYYQEATLIDESFVFPDESVREKVEQKDHQKVGESIPAEYQQPYAIL